MSASVTATAYRLPGARGSAGAAAYLLPVVRKLLTGIPRRRILDIGCGNGVWAREFLSEPKDGICTFVGIDPSESGIRLAREAVPAARFEQDVATEDLLQRLHEDPFDLVLSTEVVEHLYSPRTWARACWNCLTPGGHLICSTPYHGYLKNVAICLAGGWDKHHSVHNEGGHIKFFSRATLTDLLESAGFVDVRFAGAGRLPGLWKSMVLRARRPI